MSLTSQMKGAKDKRNTVTTTLPSLTKLKNEKIFFFGADGEGT